MVMVVLPRHDGEVRRSSSRPYQTDGPKMVGGRTVGIWKEHVDNSGLHGKLKDRCVNPLLDKRERLVNPPLDRCERYAPTLLNHHVRRVDHTMGLQDVNIWILKRDSSAREASSNVGEFLLGSPKPNVEAHGAKFSSNDNGKSLLGSVDPIGLDPFAVGSVDPIGPNPIEASSGPSTLVLDPAYVALVIDGPPRKPISLIEVSANLGHGPSESEVSFNKGGEGPLVSSDAPSGNYSLGPLGQTWVSL